MKKFYVAPEMEVEKVDVEQVLCAGSIGDGDLGDDNNHSNWD